MNRKEKENLKTALLAVAREELARFEALPADGLAFSPDFEKRFRARAEGAPEKPARPARAFPLRRLIAPVAAALVLLFLFVVPVSADGRTIAGVVKAFIFPAAEIEKIYTLDLPEKFVQRSQTDSSTSVLTVWTSSETRINLYQHIQDDSFFAAVDGTYETENIGNQLYYYKFSESTRQFQILWRTEEYDFELTFFNEDDKDVCFAILATLHVGQEFEPGNTAFRFRSMQDGYCITEYLGSGDDPAIPSEHHEMPVTAIGVNVFRNCTFLTTLHIPASIQGIQAGAFEGCVNLKNVTFSKEARIAEDAFRGCNAIENLSCSSYNLEAFPKENLKNLKLVHSVPHNFVFCRNCPNLQSVEIEEGYTNIDQNAFRGSPNLESIKLPGSVKKIGGSAFKSCKKLKEIIFPDEMEEIGAYAFEGCEALETVTIPKSVTSIKEEPFRGCLSLREINVDPENPAYSSVDGVLFTKDGKELLEYPGGKTGAYRVPDEVEKISAAAFRSCAGLTEIILPAGKGWLDSAAPKSKTGTEYAFTLFSDCSALRAVWIDGEDPQICSVDGVLFDKEKTTLLCYPGGREGAYEIPDGVSILAFGAFSGCRGLTAVTLPETLTEIRACAFEKCTALTSLHIPYSVTLIRGSAFYDRGDNPIAFSYDGTLAEWDAIQAKMDGIIPPYTVTAADGTKELPQKR
ncbi:MAG: leucine-rich repeat domain-containing protein [Clostridia bacterium]|nr:leucine-rich repeat domain-containing protein [Clostridia bacterium]